MGERIAKNEQVTEKMIQESLIKVQANMNEWKDYLSQNTDPDNPLVDFAKSVISYGNNEVELVQKRGVPEISRNLSSVIETMETISDNTPLSKAAGILTNNYPYLSQLLGIIEHIPNSPGKLLSHAGYLVLNYQADPHCYDNWKTFAESLKKGGDH